MKLRASLAVLLLAVPAAAGDLSEEVRDDWFAVYVNGEQAGHSHTRLTKERPEVGTRHDVEWITETHFEIQMSREGSPVTIVMDSRITEGWRGRVLSFEESHSTSDETITTTGMTDGDVMNLTSGGYDSTIAYPKKALGPAEIDRRVRKRGLEPGMVTDVAAFNVESPALASVVVFTVGEVETVDVFGTPTQLHAIELSNSRSTASHSVIYVDADGVMQVSESEIPSLGRLRMVRSTREQALASVTPAEVFRLSFIEPNRGIESPRKTTTSVYRFSRSDGQPVDVGLYEGEGQVATPFHGELRVEIDVWEPPDDFRALRRPVGRPEYESYLQPSAYLDSRDERVAAHAKKAVGDERDALKCARRIERYVRRFVADKDLDVGFATASEVARSAEGDCSEHAVLCAAMARAAGLPSRVVFGLVYIPGMGAAGVGPRGAFGYHMWTEVLVADQRWFPIDAALGGHDATHIALGKSALGPSDPIAELTLPARRMVRGLQIEVEEAR